ncbi:hypothetical protein D0502_03230 [Leuconostoc falkenbergense]|uniref:Uncharacterized protein n=1 Tax=Leuconostoc falkenbergense TaxID=2766470 RepID=A0A9X3IPS6_9LACO|nr:hypothetical protein [Leuconostoc falkenbergense]
MIETVTGSHHHLIFHTRRLASNLLKTNCVVKPVKRPLLFTTSSAKKLRDPCFTTYFRINQK